MRRLYVEIDDTAFRALADLAERERRPTRDQAAVLLERAALAAAGQPAAGKSLHRGSRHDDGSVLTLPYTGE